MSLTIPSFIVLISDDNKPILIYVPPNETTEVNNVLKYNTFANMALDYFDSQLFQWSSLDGHFAIKNLFELEGTTVYGMLIKPTGLKIIIGFESLILKNNEKNVNTIFEMVKRIYIRVKCNPLMDSKNESKGNLVQNLESKFDQYFNSENKFNQKKDGPKSIVTPDVMTETTEDIPINK